MTAASRIPAPTAYRIGDVVIDVARRRVSRGGRNIQIGKLSYRLLVALAEAAPRVLTREEVVTQVWAGRFVNPATIKQRVVLLRKALGDNADDPTYIIVIRGQGYGLIPPVEVVDEVDTHPGRPRVIPTSQLRARPIALALVLIAAFSIAAISILSPRTPPSVAVLPFENLSPDPADAFFATGLHEEIINQLATLEDLRVISRASVQRYARPSIAIREIAEQLNADAVMAGTLRYMDERVRISIQLMDPNSDSVLWSETYERDFADIFEIQRNIATSVTGALGVTLQVGGSDGFQGAGTENIEAYEAYLRAIDGLRRPEGRSRGIAFLQQAARLDPGYPAAWAQLGYETMATSWSAPPQQTAGILEEAYSMALRATELDPQSARAASILGTVQYERFDWIDAEKSHLRAIELNTTRFTLAQHANLLVRAGRLTAARSEFAAALSMDSTPGPQPPLRVQASIGLGEYAESTKLAQAERRPVLRDRVLLNIALNEGDRDRIVRAMKTMIETQPVTGRLYSDVLRDFDSPGKALAVVRSVGADGTIQWPAKGHDVALLAAYFGDPELALASISEEVRLSTARLWALWYPVMADVRKLPEFENLVTELNLVDYWHGHGWSDACAPLGDDDFTC